MKAKLKILRRVKAARERMRDIAAAEVAAAEQERMRRDALRAESDRVREELLHEAQNRLNEARTVVEIEAIALEMNLADRMLLEAEEALSLAVAEREDAAAELREREKQVRVSEKLVEQTKRTWRQEVTRNEQATVDDITASRWSRSDE